MNDKIIIDESLFATRAAYLKNGILHDFLWKDNFNKHNIGDIFKARIIKLDKSMDACLVDIGFDRPAYLAKTDMVANGARLKREDKINMAVKSGNEVLVQLMRMPVEQKGAKVSMRLEISGDNIVFFPEQSHIGFSKKIDSDIDKNRLKDWYKQISDDDTSFNSGLIFRTKAVKASYKVLYEELCSLKNIWADISTYRVLGKAPQKVYSSNDLVSKFIGKYSGDNVEIIRNDSDIPLFEKYGVERMLKSDLSHRVELENSGYIIIEETDACVVIDVNSGWVSDKKNLEHTAYQTNLKAAEQIARLLRVRNLSGIILIDFIDMNLEENKNNLLDKLSKFVKEDSNRVIIHGITQLGMVELTRKKTDVSLLIRISDKKEDYLFTNLNYGGVESVNVILRDIPYYYAHTSSGVLVYAICESGYKVVKNNEEHIRNYLDNYDDILKKIKIIFVLDAQNNTKRIKSGKIDELMEYVKSNYGEEKYIVV